MPEAQEVNKEELPDDVRRIVEKAERGEELTNEEAATLGGEDIELEDLGIEEPHEEDGR